MAMMAVGHDDRWSGRGFNNSRDTDKRRWKFHYESVAMDCTQDTRQLNLWPTAAVWSMCHLLVRWPCELVAVPQPDDSTGKLPVDCGSAAGGLAT